MKLNLRALLLVCIAVSVSSQSDGTPSPVRSVAIFVEPLTRPPVGTNVVIRCIGPLSNGGALIYDGKGQSKKGKTVVTFKKVKEEGSRPKLKVDGPRADNFTGILDSAREGVKLRFRVQFDDNGYYKCVFYDKTKSVNQATNSILIESFYPPMKPALKVEEKQIGKSGNFEMKIKCSGYVGYPPGSIDLKVMGVDDLKVNETLLPLGNSHEKGKVFEVKGNFPAMMVYNGTLATCTAGGGDNPMSLNTTQILNIEVPVSSAVINNSNEVFRHPGEELVCSSEGNPPPSYSWKFDGVDSNASSPTMPVPDQPGVYEVECKVSNEVKGENFAHTKRFRFAVLPKGCDASADTNSSNVALIIATVLAVLFAVISLIAIVVLIITRKRAGYDKM